jgi:c-di-AMP phosphodiesterase-like protein
MPDWFYHLLLIFSILAIASTYIIKFIPFINQYSFPIRIVGAVLFVFSVWMEGGIVNESKWQARVQELEAKIAEAEKKALETNVTIETVYVDKVKVVKEIQYVRENNIKKSASELDKMCKITPRMIEILNSGTKIEEVKK